MAGSATVTVKIDADTPAIARMVRSTVHQCLVNGLERWRDRAVEVGADLAGELSERIDELNGIV